MGKIWLVQSKYIWKLKYNSFIQAIKTNIFNNSAPIKSGTFIYSLRPIRGPKPYWMQHYSAYKYELLHESWRVIYGSRMWKADNVWFFSRNTVKSKTWLAGGSSTNIAKVIKWTNAKGRNTVKSMVMRHQMIWCPPSIRFSYNIINLHPRAVGVAIAVGPANDKSTNFVFSICAWKFGSMSAVKSSPLRNSH